MWRFDVRIGGRSGRARAETGAAGVGVTTQPRPLAARCGAGGDGAGHASGDRRGFAKGLFDGTWELIFKGTFCKRTSRRDFRRVFDFYR